MDKNSSITSGIMQRFEKIDDLLWINFYISFVLGSLLIALLVYLIIRKSPVSLKAYQPVFLGCALADALSLVIGTLCMTRSGLQNRENVAVHAGLISYAPLGVQWASLAVMLAGPSLETLFLLLEFWFRYHFLKHRHAPTYCQVIPRMLIVIFLVLFQCFFIFSNYVFNVRNNVDYLGLWAKDNKTVIPVLFITKQNPLAFWYVVVRGILTVGGYFLTIVFAFMSIRLSASGSVQLSTKTQKLLKQFTRSILVKMFLFGFLNLLPPLVVISAASGFLDMNAINPVVSLVQIWLPTLNAITTLMIMQAYRQSVVQAVTTVLRFTSIISANEISVTNVKTTAIYDERTSTRPSAVPL